jgi:hypothetical protein
MMMGRLWETGDGALRRPPRLVNLALSAAWSRA